MSESRSTPRLPWELLDAIIHELGLTLSDTSSGAALRNCALACHYLHFRADCYLFSDIVITPSFTFQPDLHVRISKRLEGLHHILTTNDSIAPRVRSFIIDTALGSVVPTEARQLILTNAYLPEILSKLCALHHFGWQNHGGTFPWTSLSENIRSRLDSLFMCPSLHSLALECINGLPPASIGRSDHLKHLRLVHIYTPASPPAAAHSSDVFEARMRLRSVTNYNSLDIFSKIFPTKEIASSCLSELRNLDVWLHNESQVSFAWSLMQTASKTLELLNIADLSHFRYPHLVPGPINISILQKLHTIKMGCRLAMLDGVIFPMGICGLLSAPTEPTMIKNVCIKLDWIDCSVGNEEARFIDEPTWSVLDGILAETFIFPALKGVEIVLRMGYGWVEAEDKQPPRGIFVIKDKVERMAAGLLPRTSASRSVKVKIDLQLYNSVYASKLSFV